MAYVRHFLSKYQAGQTKAENTNPMTVSKPNDPAKPDFLQELDSWLMQHYQENLDADKIARGMMMHRSWLHRKLKEASQAQGGLSLTKYLANFRVERARELLHTDKSLKEIAFAVGFGDYRYFARCFQERFGVTPTQWRSTDNDES